jgi:hypothetical protein
LELGFLWHARFLCNLDSALLSFLIAPCRLVGFLPALLSTASPAFGGSLLRLFTLGRSHILSFVLGWGGGLGFLERMRVIGILIHARRGSKFHGGSLLLRLLLRWDAPGLRCALRCPSGRSKSPGGRLLLYL